MKRGPRLALTASASTAHLLGDVDRSPARLAMTMPASSTEKTLDIVGRGFLDDECNETRVEEDQRLVSAFLSPRRALARSSAVEPVHPRSELRAATMGSSGAADDDAIAEVLDHDGRRALPLGVRML